ncbi:MAG: phenylacetate--CoA ligase family protein [Dissulfuribacterales bacterium]
MLHNDQKYFNTEIEPFLNTPMMREVQWEKLKPTIQFFYDNVPFDRERMDKAGVKPEDIRSLDDFSRAIPYTGQAELRELYKEVDNDLDVAFEKLFGKKRMEGLSLITSTSGTTGIPTPYPVFEDSPAAMADIFGRIGWRCGLRPGDRLAICFGLSMHGAGVPHLYWFKGLKGVTLYPIGAEAGTDRMLNMMKTFNVNVFSGTPSLALHLIERAPEVLGEPVKNLGLKTLFCGAEPGAGIPEVRKQLESAYGAELYDMGAGYGCSCNYPEYQGMHWVADDYCFYELVDPETKEPIPLEHGAKGVAVFTPLDPLSTIFFSNLRYTLNDIHQVFTDPCPCGRSGFRYKIVGRADDMLKIKGVPVYPAAIQGVINSFVPRVTGSFRIILDEPPPRVVPPLKLKVEYGIETQEADLPGLKKEILEKMHTGPKIRPEITWIKPNTLERSTKKTQLFEKTYE